MHRKDVNCVPCVLCAFPGVLCANYLSCWVFFSKAAFFLLRKGHKEKHKGHKGGTESGGLANSCCGSKAAFFWHKGHKNAR